jgi:Delta7-sterol 5-desaturase
MLDFLKNIDNTTAFALFLIENYGICLGVVLLGGVLDKTIYRLRTLITKKELWIAIQTNFLNTVVTYIGFILWREGWIVFKTDFTWASFLLDSLILFVAMDFLMFVFHFLLHKIPFLYRIHALHHEYHEPNVLDLFVLNPLEVFGFGGLWLVVIMVYEANFPAVIFYLFLNVVFGMLGHLKMEIFPKWWLENSITKHIGTTTFHQNHHAHQEHNFGFYTLIWDNIFRTTKRE